jgi:peroxisomal 3,2-trans-enoyl-CoA isomerase
VVTTGAGKFFTAGLDLLDQSVSQPDATISDEFVDTLGAIHVHLINTNKLIISAVNGPAPGKS